jgi:hypothetical protein
MRTEAQLNEVAIDKLCKLIKKGNMGLIYTNHCMFGADSEMRSLVEAIFLAGLGFQQAGELAIKDISARLLEHDLEMNRERHS